ncbi:hypothetical protein DCAR_0104018 [Daucus carota subsp. sativus]|uniref:Uncharacterized protein n=1 Tax=Daucus carota subsp. sativus TaxID=79200 RepID=A0A166IHA2_DAUCS|nr:hypothetical protein DCAR_0104018 [Daucus carota subsp. sativus]
MHVNRRGRPGVSVNSCKKGPVATIGNSIYVTIYKKRKKTFLHIHLCVRAMKALLKHKDGWPCFWIHL